MKAPALPGRVRAFAACVLALHLTSCQSLPTASSHGNPLGWPATVLGFVGTVGVDTGIPVLREAGRLLVGAGEVADAPALLVEGLVTLDPLAVVAAGQHAVAGTGQTLRAVYDLPLFAAPALQLDPTGSLSLAQMALHAAGGAPQRADAARVAAAAR